MHSQRKELQRGAMLRRGPEWMIVEWGSWASLRTYVQRDKPNQTSRTTTAPHLRGSVWLALSSMVPFRCCLRGDKDYVYGLDPDLSARNERIKVWLTGPIAPGFCPSIGYH